MAARDAEIVAVTPVRRAQMAMIFVSVSFLVMWEDALEYLFVKGKLKVIGEK